MTLPEGRSLDKPSPHLFHKILQKQNSTRIMPTIARRSSAEIERIRASCQIVVEVRQALEAAIAPGITTLELDALAEKTIRSRNARPAFKGYHGFPASICASIDAETVHGFPGRTRLREGSIISIDVGVELDGYFGDAAFTLGIGQIRPELQHLLATTRACLEAGIQQARAGNRVSDISHAIQTGAEAAGLAVIREFGGHGIGRALHEEPHIPNHGPPGRGSRLHAGNVLAIEPILSLGSPELVVADDQWTTLTRDRRPSAHSEHTVAITENGPQVLTRPATGTSAADRGT